MLLVGWQEGHPHSHSPFYRPFFQVNLGYPVALLILLLRLFLNCASFWDRHKLSMSSITQSHQVFVGCPLYLIPSSSYVIQRLTQSLSAGRSGLAVACLTAVREVLGSNCAVGSCVYRTTTAIYSLGHGLCAPFLQCLGQLSLLPYVGR